MLEISVLSPCGDIFVDRLRNSMREINPVANSTHGLTQFYINPSLKTCTHVFLRVKAPSSLPYTDPHKILKRTEKYLYNRTEWPEINCFHRSCQAGIRNSYSRRQSFKSTIRKTLLLYNLFRLKNTILSIRLHQIKLW
ncbi:uncharacterized protein NPIL_432491 [Nephila pilipes]|uniref:Uncharacterized protein n=1 Tax=Nephila pilipes TaxID=299642 RepID=A0A8X6Q282_NEPPI|nr:uncharacterized protein NPIL_432491 [Nephila pilipes]